jgi:hypothetical protein
MLTLLISGCSYKKVVRQEEVKNKHNIIIVPFKAPPVAIMGGGLGSFILGGYVGVALVDAATKEGRTKVVDRLNEISDQWNPSVVIAQECQTLIKGSTVLQIENVTIVDSRELPGTEDLRSKEPKLFTTQTPFGLGGGWMRAGSRWVRESKSPIKYRQDYPESTADWSLEVFSTYITLAKMKKIEFNVILKLVDTSSGEKIALDGTYDTFEISLAKDISNFKTLEEEFRNASRQLCSKVLSKMGLISIH